MHTAPQKRAFYFFLIFFAAPIFKTATSIQQYFGGGTTIIGSNFGVNKSQISVWLGVGDTIPCHVNDVINQTIITCTIDQQFVWRNTMLVFVEVAGQTSSNSLALISFVSGWLVGWWLSFFFYFQFFTIFFQVARIAQQQPLSSK